MQNVIFEGREEVEVIYNNINTFIYNILEKDDLSDFIISLDTILDEMVLETNSSDMFSIFKHKYFELLNSILIKYGIKVESDEVYTSHYSALFNFIYNMKFIDFHLEQVELILDGDYHLEDKLFMLFSLIFESPTEILEHIDISELFIIKVKEFISKSSLKEDNKNIDMILRCFNFISINSIFKNTLLFNNINIGYYNIMLELRKDEELIIKEIKDRIKPYLTSYSYDKLLNLVINEVVMTFLYYNQEDILDVNKTVTIDLLERIIEKPITNKNEVITKILELSLSFNKDK